MKEFKKVLQAFGQDAYQIKRFLEALVITWLPALLGIGFLALVGMSMFTKVDIIINITP